MKSTVKAIALASAIIALSACSNSVVKNSVSVNPGDSKQQVIAAMGTPQNRQFDGIDDAWQYCNTHMGVGSGAGIYRIVWFANGRVTGLTSYQTSLVGKSCSSQFKEVNWREAPDRVVEYRVDN